MGTPDPTEQSTPAPPSDSGPRCPTCGTRISWTANSARPFCSVACKLIDLGGWLDETYRVPGEPLATESTEPETPGDVPPGRR